MSRMVPGRIPNGPVSTAMIMLAIFLAMTLLALTFPPKARLMPLIVGVAGSLLGLIQVILEIRASAAGPSQVDDPGREERVAEGMMLVWTLLFFAGILIFGFLYASPVLVFAFLYYGKAESLKIAAISAVCTWVVLFGFFESWLGIPLFEGLLFEWG